MKRIVSALALSTLALGAQGQLFYSGGTPTSFTGYNPSSTTATQSFGIVNPTVNSLSEGVITVTFLGYEAHHTDHFRFPVGTLMTNKTAVADVSSMTDVTSAGRIGFRLQDLTVGETVEDGGSDGVFASFAILGSNTGAGFVPYTKGGLYDFVLGFNDGSPVDADYDDMVLGLRVASAISEPGAFALMLAGLVALTAYRRRLRGSKDGRHQNDRGMRPSARDGERQQGRLEALV